MNSFLQDVDTVALLCGLAAFAVVILIWNAFLDKDPLADRLKSVAMRRDEFEAERRKKNSRRASLQTRSLIKQVVERFKLSQGKSLADLRLKLRQAGYQSRDAIFIFLFAKFALMIAFGVGGLSSAIFLPPNKAQGSTRLFLIVLGAGLGWLLPDLFIKNKAQKRAEILRRAMPDALDLMVICAEAGLGLDSALDRVGREIGLSCPELAEEIGLTSVEMNFLPDRHAALRGLAERIPLPSVLALVNTLIQTEKYGTPLAQSLRVLSAEMREERMMKAEEKAAKLPAILTVPMILFILPPLFVVLMGPAILRVSAIMGKH